MGEKKGTAQDCDTYYVHPLLVKSGEGRISEERHRRTKRSTRPTSGKRIASMRLWERRDQGQKRYFEARKIMLRGYYRGKRPREKKGDERTKNAKK